MQYIVDADRPRLKERLDKSVAVSIAVDGSVDRFQVDNKHVKCRIVAENGAKESMFWGFDETHERRSAGYVGAVTSAVEWCVP